MGEHTNKGFVPDGGVTEKGLNGSLRKRGGNSDVDYEPYDHRVVEHPISNADTLIHLLKGSLGTGLLAMPNAFGNSGYILGLVGTIVIGFICTYCVHLLLNASYELCKRNKRASLTYPGTAELALLEGPPFLKKVAPYSQHIVNAFLFVNLMGLSSVYIIFIASNLKSVFDQYTENDLDIGIYMLMFLLPLILLNYLRNLKVLAPFSTGANLVTFVSFGFLLYYIITGGPTFEDRLPVGKLENIPLYFGTVLFALEAISVILPLENEMKTPKYFGSHIGVLNIAMCVVVGFYTLLGLLGYMTYGTDVKGTITLNMPDDEIPAQVIKVLYAVAIFITYGVQFYVTMEIAWKEYLGPKLEKNEKKLLWEYVTRTVLILITFGLAISVPELDLFISLFGAFCLSILGIAMPATIDICTYWYVRKGATFYISVSKNVFLILFGLTGLAVGTSISIRDMVVVFSKPSDQL